MRGRLAAIDPACADLPLLHADVDDPRSLRALAEATKVVITTVGPYIRYGEPLVAACAAAGTDYVDLTGEPEFVDRMWLRYHEQAERSGARLVHSCGFDSIPYDLGVQFTVEHLPEDVPISIDGFMRTKASFSGGTYQSAIEILGAAAVGREGRTRAPQARGRPAGRRVRGVVGQAAPPTSSRAAGSSRSRRSIPRPCCARRGRSIATDPISATATTWSSGRCRCSSGSAPWPVSWSRWRRSRRPATCSEAEELGGGSVGGAAREVVVQRPVRGPRRERATARTLRTEVRGGDPGYGETSKMLAESALCLAYDDLPERAGQLTPAVAMGPALRRRLEAAGIEFKVLDGRESDWTAADIPDQSGRVAVVTGANSGLGLVTARELARAGARVVLASRSAEKGRDAAARIVSAVPGADVSAAILDLADLELGAGVRRDRAGPARPADQQRRA